MKRFVWIIIGAVLLVLIIVALKTCSGDNGIEISTEMPKLRNITEIVSANGKIQPETEVKISSDVSGEIVELFVKEGDRVKKGALLCRIKPDIYESALDRANATVNSTKASMQNMMAQLEQSKANFANAEANFSRNKKLFDQQVISQQDYDASKAQYESAKAQIKALEESVKGAEYNISSVQASMKEATTNLAKTFIYAPVDATVSKLNKKLGERVVGTATMEGTEIMRLADLNEMEVNVDVNENDIIRVHLKDTSLIEVDAYNDRKFKGIVTEVANSANTTGLNADQVTNYTVKIRVLRESYIDLITDKNPVVFRPGMSASVEILTRKEKNVLSIPIQAVTTRTDSMQKPVGAIAETKPSGGDDEGVKVEVNNDKKDKKEEEKEKKPRPCIFVLRDGKAKIIFVKTGIQDNEYIQVTEGITEKDEVISSPYGAISKMLYHNATVKKVAKDKLFKIEVK
ncbi:MAG TPA: efflux RND transporter periplasmic adaptor subunit [Bacteroidia bacterium]|jgi:HlyD family secretion protein|nr:efflux RND transporter periplasmic adaptor subunit [Bacteroidia bacterium]